MSKQWVQYKNDKNGEKFFVEDENERVWIINEPCFMRLPKSEYRLCPAPEVWVDVTEECEVEQGAIYHKGERMYWANGYRPRKVSASVELSDKRCWRTGWAFIVEKKVSE